MSHDPTEHVQEEIHHHAAHGEGGHGPRWITAAALTAAFLAAFAAVSSSLATGHLTQATLTRIAANDNWTYYQSKSIKSSILDSRIYDARLAATQPSSKDLNKKAEYEHDMPEIQTRAEGLETLSKAHLHTHETYETSATMFHIAIAIVAIAVVARRKEFWYVSLAGGVIGLCFFGVAFAHAPSEPAEPHETATTHVAGSPEPAAAPSEHHETAH